MSCSGGESLPPRHTLLVDLGNNDVVNSIMERKINFIKKVVIHLASKKEKKKKKSESTGPSLREKGRLSPLPLRWRLRRSRGGETGFPWRSLAAVGGQQLARCASPPGALSWLRQSQSAAP